MQLRSLGREHQVQGNHSSDDTIQLLAGSLEECMSKGVTPQPSSPTQLCHILELSWGCPTSLPKSFQTKGVKNCVCL